MELQNTLKLYEVTLCNSDSKFITISDFIESLFAILINMLIFYFLLFIFKALRNFLFHFRLME